MRKKITLLFLCCTLFLSLTACSKKDVKTTTNNNDVIKTVKKASSSKKVPSPTDTPKSGVEETKEKEKNLKKDAIDTTIKEFQPVPAAYTTQDSNKGTIERLDYSTQSYDSNNQKLEKYLNVYLPKGYNPDDKKTKYNVFYLIHGGGENQDTVFGGVGQNRELMRILDNMISNGDIDPLIIVTPNFYNSGNDNASSLTRNFHNELIKDIIPAVESKYHTYAASTSKKDLIAARNHRAFGGFSMGSACTWYSYINCLDYFTYFMPLSGDCWELGDAAGQSKPQETAEFLANVAKKSGYGPDEYYLFCATGTNDMAYGNMLPQIEAMKKFTDSFVYTTDFTKGNLHFMVMQGGSHSWNYVNQYIYNALPYFFFK